MQAIFFPLKIGSMRASGLSCRKFAADMEDGAVSFNIYLIGFVILIAGLVYGATLMGIPNQWIAAGTIVMVGLGVMSAVKGTRQKDPPTP